MDDTQYSQLMAVLHEIDRKVSSLEVEVASLKTGASAKGSLGENLKSEFDDFKSQWQSESPDMQNLKDNLLKLRASLGGLSQVLSGTDTTGSVEQDKG